MEHISVIIPNYNRASLIGETIENMLGQSVAPHEIIVVDDGSTDNSREVISSFGSRVRLIEQTNQGPGAARNAGFAASTGEFIQFMDSDDLASRNKLAVQLAALQQADGDFAYCPWVRTEILGKKLKISSPVMQGDPLPAWRSMLEWQMGPWCLVFQNCLFRRGVLLKAGQFHTDLMGTEDSEYLVRILLCGASPVFTGDCLVFYRAHPQGQLTGSGVCVRRQADDWTRYFEVVGEDVSARIGSFHPVTRREIALQVFRHNRYCCKQGWPGLPVESPFSGLTASFSAPRLVWLDYLERVQRKLSGLSGRTPNSAGLCLRKLNSNDRKLADEIGFIVN